MTGSLAWQSEVKKRGERLKKAKEAGVKPIEARDIFIERRELEERPESAKINDYLGLAELDIHVRQDVLENLGLPREDARHLRSPLPKMEKSINADTEPIYRNTGSVNLRLIDAGKLKKKLETADKQEKEKIMYELERLREKYDIDVSSGPKVLVLNGFMPLTRIEMLPDESSAKIMRHGIGEKTLEKIISLYAKPMGVRHVVLETKRKRAGRMVDKPENGFVKTSSETRISMTGKESLVSHYRKDMKKGTN